MVNEDGDTLLSFPESLDFDSHGGTLIRLGGNIYISPDDGHTIRQKTTYYQIGKKIENMEGDVNGDGTVNIADVTKLVNIILQQ